MHSFSSFHIQVENSILFPDCGIFGEKGTGLTGTESCYIILISTETLCFCSNTLVTEQEIRDVLYFERAKVVVYDIPY